jgi:hypothetical protein
VTEVSVVAPVLEPRHVLVSLRKGDERTISDGFPKPTEETDTEWRFALDLKADETRSLRLATDTMDGDSVAIDQASDVLAVLTDVQAASDAVQAAVAHVAELRRQESASQDALGNLTADRDRLDAEEKRTRENLAATSAGDALHARLMRQLDADETRYGKLAEAIDAANVGVSAAHKALINAISGLDF